MNETGQRWIVIFKRQAQRTLQRLPKDVQKRIDQAISVLIENPQPPGSKKLVGHHKLYRLRVGSWRIIYVIESDEFIILVIKIAPRGGAYKRD